MSGFAKVTPIRVLPRVSGLNFTRKNLDALGLPRHGRRDYYHDEKVRGLALAVYPSGRKKGKAAGHPRRRGIGRDAGRRKRSDQ